MIKITHAFEPSARITGEVRAAMGAEMAQLYRRGYSIRALADASGRSYGWVHRVLKEAGVVLRGRGGSKYNGKRNRKR